MNSKGINEYYYSNWKIFDIVKSISQFEPHFRVKLRQRIQFNSNQSLFLVIIDSINLDITAQVRKVNKQKFIIGLLGRKLRKRKHLNSNKSLIQVKVLHLNLK